MERPENGSAGQREAQRDLDRMLREAEQRPGVKEVAEVYKSLREHAPLIGVATGKLGNATGANPAS